MPEVRAVGGPTPEPRVAVINRAGGSSTRLLEAIDRALEAMRADGTLAALSRASFGSDLASSVP
jgi:ABC-type amino acid transport substrate-binding protein